MVPTGKHQQIMTIFLLHTQAKYYDASWHHACIGQHGKEVIVCLNILIKCIIRIHYCQNHSFVTDRKLKMTEGRTRGW